MMLGHLMLALSVTDRLIFVAGHRKKDGWRRLGATRTRRTPCPARWRPAGPKPRGCRRPKIRMDMRLQVEMRRSDSGWLGMRRSGDSSFRSDGSGLGMLRTPRSLLGKEGDWC